MVWSGSHPRSLALAFVNNDDVTAEITESPAHVHPRGTRVAHGLAPPFP